MQPNHEQLDPGDDLRWLAFQYVAGELAGAELERFEASLLEDQAAREAVGEAVELTQATHLACRRPAVVASRTAETSTSARWVPAAWMTIGAALSLLLVIGLQFARWPTPPSDSDGKMADPGLLAVAWIENSENEEVRSLWGTEPTADEEWDHQAPWLAEDETVGDDDGGWMAPSWMESAIAGMAAEGSQDGDSDSNHEES